MSEETSPSLSDLDRDQLERLNRGTIPVRLLRPCTLGDGILSLSSLDSAHLSRRFRKAQAAGRITKWVPASGAATRMFKEVLAALSELDAGRGVSEETGTTLRRLRAGLSNFPFSGVLENALSRPLQQSFDADPAAVLRAMLAADGLNLASLPKALVPFHRYGRAYRAPIAEHLCEALDFVVDEAGRARIHFTLAAASLDCAKQGIEAAKAASTRAGVEFVVSCSVQDPSTDTIAIDTRGEVVLNPDGSVYRRPGGHGALIKNLGDLGADIIALKNIDNVVPDHLKAAANAHRVVLGGLLVLLQEQIHDFMHQLEAALPEPAKLDEMLEFARRQLFAIDTPPKSAAAQIKARYLAQRFDRPFRVCGVVPSTGEPGGGPFWTADNTQPLQIVEFASVDRNDAEQAAIWQSSTHFNPVDLMCSLRDHRGRPYQLSRFADPDAAMVVDKSLSGASIRAMELPGLWNGAMARWNTVFVEVPLASFNPVKTVFDLLRDAHQPA